MNTHACLAHIAVPFCSMPPKWRRSTGPLQASMVEVLTPHDPFVNQQRISCKIPWYQRVILLVNNIVMPTASTKVLRTCKLHRLLLITGNVGWLLVPSFSHLKQKVPNSTLSDTKVLGPPLPTITGSYVLRK